jgi:hypothetical protein
LYFEKSSFFVVAASTSVLASFIYSGDTATLGASSVNAKRIAMG